RNCFLPPAAQRRQHRHRRNDWVALHDVAGSRNAAGISAIEPPRRSDLSAAHRARSADTRPASGGKLHRAGWPLRDRRRRRDHGECRLVRIQPHRRFYLVRSCSLRRDVLHFVPGRADVGAHKTGRALFRGGDSGRWTRLARVHAKTAGSDHADRDARSRANGCARSRSSRATGFALDEAQLRTATLCVLYVKEVAVYFSGGPASLGRAKWHDDPEANAIMSLMMKLGAERDVCVIPVYAVSQDAAATIVDLSATM